MLQNIPGHRLVQPQSTWIATFRSIARHFIFTRNHAKYFAVAYLGDQTIIAGAAAVSDLLHLHLSRRESQIMDVLFRLGEASVSDVVAQIPDEPSYNTVRVTLGILENKGYVQHREDGPRYMYCPAQSLDQVKRSATRHLLQTFYGGSPSRAILSLLGMSAKYLSQEDLDDIAGWIEDAKVRAEREKKDVGR